MVKLNREARSHMWSRMVKNREARSHIAARAASLICYRSQLVPPAASGAGAAGPAGSRSRAHGRATAVEQTRRAGRTTRQMATPHAELEAECGFLVDWFTRCAHTCV